MKKVHWLWSLTDLNANTSSLIFPAIFSQANYFTTLAFSLLTSKLLARILLAGSLGTNDNICKILSTVVNTCEISI